MEIKYTNDGRKVVVMGDLNSQEKIVQEILISGDSEIPSGENFVVKTLYDNPVISWREKTLKDFEDKYNKRMGELVKMEKDLVVKSGIIRARLSFLEKFNQNFSEIKFQRLIDFISGDINYVVYDGGCSNLGIFDFNKICDIESREFCGIKLLSAYGTSDGDITYRMNRWGDGSGYNSDIYTFKTKEDAIHCLSDIINGGKYGLTDYLISVASKWDIDIPKHKMDEFRLKKSEMIQIKINEHKKQIDELKESLLKL